MPSSRAAISPEASAIVDDIRRIVAALRASSRAAERAVGVTGAQLFVLQVLAREQALSVNELAERTRTHQSTVSVVVRRLVERGLVARAAAADDGRRVMLSLTKEGRALLRRAPAAAQEKLIGGLEQLPAEQHRLLATSLRALVVAMGLEEAPAQMFFEDEESQAPAGAPAKKRRAARVSA
jgi:DNA-binding MarR family transcriptional regulator